MFRCIYCLSRNFRGHSISLGRKIGRIQILRNTYCTEKIDNGKTTSFTRRTHHCGELRESHVGQKVTLSGWLQYNRMDGQFFTMKDAHGVTQVTVPSYAPGDLREVVCQIPKESIVEVTGQVFSRPPGQENEKMLTGTIEVVANKVKLLNPCSKELPFQMHEFHKVNEALRMEYRYLDLRHSEMQRNLRFRSKTIMKMRDFLCNKHAFVDVETPTLFRRTPGGAREFIVPTHTPGKYYCLPQSPQQFKQLLMVGAIDRYMQIARCYRDEQAKPERQPEFTQLDLEMSFAGQEDIKLLIEDLLEYCWSDDFPPLERPFPRLSYGQAIAMYGTDKPDTRFDMKLQDITEWLPVIDNKDLYHLSKAIDEYPETSVQAINFTQAAAHLTKSDMKKLRDVADMFCRDKVDPPWFAITKVKDGGSWSGGLEKALGFDLHNLINGQLNLNPGDLLLISAGQHTPTCCLLGQLRLKVADLLEKRNQIVRGNSEQKNFLWVEDFPLFLPKEDGGPGLVSAHHPFTAPHPDDVVLTYTTPEVARSQHYDLVLNGSEIGGGSIRIHDADLQVYILTEVLKEDIKSLEHLLDALKSGCPPHGGIALGLDRLFAILCGTNTIRDVIAFPKSSRGEDLMAKAPAVLDHDEAIYYHQRVRWNHNLDYVDKDGL